MRKMPHLLLLMKLSVILLLVPLDECRQIFDNDMAISSAESKLLESLLNSQPTEPNGLPSMKKQLTRPLDQLISSFYKSAKPSATSLSEPSNPTYSKGQESSWYIKGPHSEKIPFFSTLNSNQNVQEMVPPSEPQLSNLVAPMDQDWKSNKALSDTLSYSDAASILCALKKQLLKQAQPAKSSTTSELSKPYIYPKDQESSWYLKGSDSKKFPLLASLNSNQVSEEKVPSDLSNLVVPIDESFESLTGWNGDIAVSDTLQLPTTTSILATLENQLLKETQSGAVDFNAPDFLEGIRSHPDFGDQPQSSRTRTKKIKIRLKPNPSAKLAEDRYGSKKIHSHSIAKKLKIFKTNQDALKFKQKLKLRLQKRNPAKKIKLIGGDPFKVGKNQVVRSRKSERCYKTRKGDGTSTVCVTYPASWGQGANYTIRNGTPYPYYYPYYYYPTYYYYPYYYYGRR